MLCPRCNKECKLTHRVTSDMISLEVCDECSSAAYDLAQWQPKGDGAITIVPIGEAR